ncbi:MAG: hypothetical protein JWL66_2977 [Sphingomonadales bacterium]|nr:hypothetical protein [Sphingomonadales bacterium]
MVELCAAPATAGLGASLLADVDCQAFGLVERGYAALSASGGAAANALTGLLVIAVAFFGYRLLLGRGLSLGSTVGLVNRIGVVLLLAGSWESWQTIGYDTLARAPTRIAGDLMTAIGAPEPLSTLQPTLDQLEAAGTGWRMRAGIASPLVGGPPTAAMTLNVAGFLLLVSSIGLLVVARLVLALLLAITPAVAGFFLFDATRGLVEGWLRAMIAAALIPLAVLILLSVELSILAPMIARMVAQLAAGVFDQNAVTPIGLVVIVFTVAVAAAARAMGIMARGLRLPRAIGGETHDEGAPVVPLSSASVRLLPMPGGPVVLPSIARALESASRRDAAIVSGGNVVGRFASRQSIIRDSGGSSTGPAPARSPAASRPQRTILPRASRSAARRDA